MISVSESRAVLQDLGSKNGTYVDGERVTVPTRWRMDAKYFWALSH